MLTPSFYPSSPSPTSLSHSLQGLSLIFVNFLTLLYYNPTLSVGFKPLHVSKGGMWDPLFPPTASESSTLHSIFTWLGVRAGAESAEAAPRWLYWTFSVGLFAYQSLDAIDGKQARRTGTSGPVRSFLCLSLSPSFVPPLRLHALDS